MTETIAYKILTAADLAALQAGVFTGAPVDVRDGYIHLSSAAQVDETVAKHFAGQMDLAIAAVDLARLGDALCWEPSRHGQLFPHLYAPLTMDCVIACMPLQTDPAGAVQLPA
jgi:uncharacterized protein (DUF952 family)